MKETEVNGRIVYICEECGFGYADKATAQRCEKYCSTYKSCSLEITRNAIYVPKSK